jgi:single-strand DNA-binding protein
VSRDLNRVCLIGRVGNRPEVGATAGGARVASFRIATDRPVRAGMEGRTDWHTVVAWDRLVSTIEREVRLGDRVYVEGRLETRERSGRKGRRTVTEIMAEMVIPLGERPDSWQPAAPDAGEGGGLTPFARRPRNEDVEEDLPF